jgi:hypothetical protein
MRKSQMSQEVPVPASIVRKLVKAAVPEIEEQSAAGRVYNSNAIQASVAHAIHRDSVLSKEGEFISVEESKLSTLKAFAKHDDNVENLYDEIEKVNKFIENQHEKN